MFRSCRFPLTKAALSLCLAATSSLLLTLRPALAQGPPGGSGGFWAPQPCDAQGNILYSPPVDNQGFYGMSGTQSGTASNTYPAPMVAAAVADPADYGRYLSAGSPLQFTTIPPNFIASQRPLITSYPTPGSYASNELDDGSFWYYVPPQYGSPNSGFINGSVTDKSTGQLVFYFKEVWNGSGAPTVPMPDHLYALLKTQVYAAATLNYDYSGLTSGLSASASATDGQPYNEMVSASGDAGTALRPGYIVDAHWITGYHLFKSAVNPQTCIAQTYLNGTITQAASDSIPAGAFGQYGLYVTNGFTQADGDSGVGGGVKLAAAGLNATYINLSCVSSF